MKATWGQISDYVRGIASGEDRLAVEQDPEASERIFLLRQVLAAAADPAPEFFVNRAKALLPVLPTTYPRWIGRLVFSGQGGMPGFRHGGSAARDLRFEFDDAEVELRLEPIPNTTRLSVVGLFTGPASGSISVKAGASEAFCDEIGEFMLEIARDEPQLTFEAAGLRGIYQVNLQ